MELVDVIIVAVIVLAVGGALAYIIRAKKRGKKCIGCPAGSSCEKGRACNCGCGGCENKSKEDIS